MRILELLRQTASESPCPSCRASLEGCGMELLRGEQNLFTVEVTCARCRVVFIVIVRLDVEAESAPASSGAPPISADEVLDVHLALAKLSGPITRLLSVPSERQDD